MTGISPRILTIPKFFIVLGFLLLPFTFLLIFLNLSVSDVLFMIAFIGAMLILIPFRVDSIERLFSGNPFFVPILILTAGFLLSLSNAVHPVESFTAYIQIFFIFCVLYPLFRLMAVEERFIRKLLICFVLTTGLVSITLMVFTIYGFDVSYGLFLLQEGWRGRYSYGGFEPNIPARIVLQIAPLCAAYLLITRSVFLKAINLFLIFISCFVVVSTASRSSLLALVIGVVIYPIFLKRTNPGLSTKRIVGVLCVIACIGILTSLYVTQESAFEVAAKRYETILTPQTSFSSLKRISLLDQSIDQITSNPIIGVGLENYTLYTREGINVHNPLLAMWAENGLLGMIGFSMIYFILAVYCIKSWKRRLFGNYLFMGLTILVILMIIGDMFMTNSYKRVLWVPALLFLTYYEVLLKNDQRGKEDGRSNTRLLGPDAQGERTQ